MGEIDSLIKRITNFIIDERPNCTAIMEIRLVTRLLSYFGDVSALHLKNVLFRLFFAVDYKIKRSARPFKPLHNDNIKFYWMISWRRLKIYCNYLSTRMLEFCVTMKYSVDRLAKLHTAKKIIKISRVNFSNRRMVRMVIMRYRSYWNLRVYHFITISPKISLKLIMQL